ncbi:ATP-binding SpoIIE family protein phosphatase [Streptomyces olivoreticuli]|uniref:ATP-binding SpoIIE family protein phosphatase n=1 Tax=Streptomyces olivoreticuli TaxID=68246 RepID=UPI000E231869|nr:ATP-binding SpoIIE family protein phosphatase [Streptomyces olivoreticuli]
MTEHPNSHGRQRTAPTRQAAARQPAAPAPGTAALGSEAAAAAARLPRQPDGRAGGPRDLSRPESSDPATGRAHASAEPAEPGRAGEHDASTGGPADGPDRQEPGSGDPASGRARASGAAADGPAHRGPDTAEPGGPGRAASGRGDRDDSGRAGEQAVAHDDPDGSGAPDPSGSGRARPEPGAGARGAAGGSEAAGGAHSGPEAPSAGHRTPGKGSPSEAAGSGRRAPGKGSPSEAADAGRRAPEAPGAAGMPSAGTTGGERLRFVGAATRRIARGIDLDEIVLGLCRATVPTFADAILVYLRDPLPVGDERPVGPVVLRLRRTDQLPEHVRGLGDPADPDAPADRGDPATDLAAVAAERCEVRIGGPLAEVLRGVRPVYGDSSAARAALPELLGEDRTVPDRQRTILAPLRGRRRVIGAAVFIRRADRPAFEGDDLLVAAQLATHTALGVDKAVLYGREVYIADELQRTMLPDSLPQPTGVRLASRYLPAAETARVGGDWYDAIPLPGNRVALVVGDVMGHSMTSAAIMGQLRTTAQTLAGLDLPPAEVLHHLDEQAQRLGSDRMATCLYAVYDPVAHRIVIANAGHPPPIMLHRGGRAEVLRVPPGAPIGVGGVDFEAVELDAPAGATLLLYTDGLVESRIRDVWTGIEQLRERLIETARLTGPNPPPLEPLCDEVLGMLGPGDRDDDIALLAARFEGIAPSDVAYWFLDPRPQTARQARRLAKRALARWGLDELSDAVELLVSEVITNAVRYAERPISLRLLRTDVLRCEVGDDVPQLPRLRQARPSDEGGRGLYLVNRLARRWGATRLSTGKVVWFEMALPAHAR